MLEYLRLYIKLNLCIVGAERQNRASDWGADDF